VRVSVDQGPRTLRPHGTDISVERYLVRTEIEDPSEELLRQSGGPYRDEDGVRRARRLLALVLDRDTAASSPQRYDRGLVMVRLLVYAVAQSIAVC